MTEFKQGDRVRLKLKPEVEMTLRHPAMRGRWEAHSDKGSDGYFDVYYRWPEEIELVPRPIRVGDLVKYVGDPSGLGSVKAVFDEGGRTWMVVWWVDSRHPFHYDADDQRIVRA